MYSLTKIFISLLREHRELCGIRPLSAAIVLFFERVGLRQFDLYQRYKGKDSYGRWRHHESFEKLEEGWLVFWSRI